MFTNFWNIHYIYDKTDTPAVVRRPWGVPKHAGGAEQHNIAEAAPNELKLGEGR